MTALAKGTQRNNLSDPGYDSAPQKGSTTVFQGSMVMLDSSGRALAAAASIDAAAFCVGCALALDRDLDRYDNSTGSDGDKTVAWEEGVFAMQNDGVSPVLSTTQPGTVLYAKDDNTVSLSDGSATRPVAGILHRYDTSFKTGPVGVRMSKEIGKTQTQMITAIDPANMHLAGAEVVTGVKTFTADPAFTKEAGHTVAVTATTTAATAGGALTIAAAKSGTSGTGGAIALKGGAGDTTGVGGAASLVGGAGGSVSGTGGAVALTGGAGSAGNATGGAVNIDGGAKNGSGADGLISIGVTSGSFVKFGKKIQATATAFTVADPGTGVAIPVTASGVVPIVTAAAETNTLADPTFIGQTLDLICDTYAVGNRVVTAASRINQAANTIMTFGAVGDYIRLVAVTIGGALKWQVAANDGVALS